MELLIYDKELTFCGIIDSFTSLIWTRKYHEPGNFELHLPLTSETFKLIKDQNIVGRSNAVEAGIIEAISLKSSDKGDIIVIKGRFLSSFLDRRIMLGTLSVYGRVENAIRDIVNYSLINPVDMKRAIRLIELGTLQGYSPTMVSQFSDKNVLELCKILSLNSGLGYRIRPDFENKRMIFEVYSGTNHSIDQLENPPFIFSDELETLSKSIYEINTSKSKNAAYIAGEGEGDDRKRVETGNSSGLERRELFVDARDIRQDTVSDLEYSSLLLTRGTEKLNENAIYENFEGTANTHIGLIYKKDWNLGDIVTVTKNNWGQTMNARISEIVEVYEDGNEQIIPVFGSQYPTSVIIGR